MRTSPSMIYESLKLELSSFGEALIVQEVSRLIRIQHPEIFFLIETKKKQGEMDWLRARWGFNFV